ncbi:hypothetical protein AQUSIP_17160 [Aquicella siphonis]|uniref:Uncharacterized protein n=1 Tax=Aquicella siphonis TaxID=254247 RepID=A0A5E4PHL1_9COXI|nr:hypothetical protein AQUSIP_17160 [Aquicella siphonis]
MRAQKKMLKKTQSGRAGSKQKKIGKKLELRRNKAWG